MRGIKKELFAIIAAAGILASPVQGATLSQKGVDFYADAVTHVMGKTQYMDKAYAGGIIAGLEEQGLDQEDKDAVFDEIGEDNYELEMLLKSVDSQSTDNTSPGDDEPNSIDTNPFNYLSKLTPEEWAENTIKVMKGQRGRAANESHLDSMQDFKSNMVKADTPEASKFYQKAIELLKASGISFTG